MGLGSIRHKIRSLGFRCLIPHVTPQGRSVGFQAQGIFGLKHPPVL